MRLQTSSSSRSCPNKSTSRWLATFTPRRELRRWLHDELLAWAREHDEDLRRRDVLAVVPPKVKNQVQNTRGAAKLLTTAADNCLTMDEQQDSVETLGQFYAGVALLVYEIKESKDDSGDTSHPEE